MTFERLGNVLADIRRRTEELEERRSRTEVGQEHRNLAVCKSYISEPGVMA
jgi:hypothetical protein